MDYLFLLQFACFLFMLFCALVLCITRLHVKWLNQRYEWSRWLIFTALIGLAMHFLMQMFLGFRARGDVMGAIINMLVYPPCYSLIAMGIYNIEATHANRWKMNIACAGIYAVILTAFGIGYAQNVLLQLFGTGKEKKLGNSWVVNRFDVILEIFKFL